MGLFNWIEKILGRESKEDLRRSELIAYELQEKVRENERKFTRERDYYFNKRPSEIVKSYYSDLSEQAQERIADSLEFEQRKNFSHYNDNYKHYEEKAFAVRNRLREEEKKTPEYRMNEISRQKVRDYYESKAQEKRKEIANKNNLLKSRLDGIRRERIEYELAA